MPNFKADEDLQVLLSSSLITIRTLNRFEIVTAGDCSLADRDFETDSILGQLKNTTSQKRTCCRYLYRAGHV